MPCCCDPSCHCTHKTLLEGEQASRVLLLLLTLPQQCATLDVSAVELKNKATCRFPVSLTSVARHRKLGQLPIPILQRHHMSEHPLHAPAVYRQQRFPTSLQEAKHTVLLPLVLNLQLTLTFTPRLAVEGMVVSSCNIMYMAVRRLRRRQTALPR